MELATAYKALVKETKAVLDPDDIMNPGKLSDPEASRLVGKVGAPVRFELHPKGESLHLSNCRGTSRIPC